MCKKKDPNKKGFFAEFKEFITRGNVLDMAVGVIIGGAFTAIVTALTGGILQPVINYLIGLMLGDASLEACRTILGKTFYTFEPVINPETGETIGATKVIDWSKTNFIDWGAFISAVINFIIVAFIVFLIVKAFNKARAAAEAKKKKEEEAAPAPEPEPEVDEKLVLLTEIRDLLKKQ